jgi:hypothetical protein
MGLVGVRVGRGYRLYDLQSQALSRSRRRARYQYAIFSSTFTLVQSTEPCCR